MEFAYIKEKEIKFKYNIIIMTKAIKKRIFCTRADVTRAGVYRTINKIIYLNTWTVAGK